MAETSALGPLPVTGMNHLTGITTLVIHGWYGDCQIEEASDSRNSVKLRSTPRADDECSWSFEPLEDGDPRLTAFITGPRSAPTPKRFPLIPGTLLVIELPVGRKANLEIVLEPYN